MTTESHSLLTEIVASVHLRYAALNRHYEAGWTESWCHRRCLHSHRTLTDAAKCAMPHGCGWYVFAVEYDMPRELTDNENSIVDGFRFGL